MNNSFTAFIKRKNESMHRTETLYIASILAIIGGFADSHTYITRDGIFAYAQTGNIIFFAMSLAGGHFFNAVYYLIPILIFVAGICFALYIKKIINKKNIIEFEYAVILINSVIFFIVGLLPESFPNAAASGIMSFMSAVFMITFNKVEGLSYITNMCTGNLRSISENLFKFLFSKDKSGLKNAMIYFTILFSFTLGVVLGAFFTNIFGIRSIWITSVLLLIVESLMFFDK